MKQLYKKPHKYWQRCRKKETQRRITLMNNLFYKYLNEEDCKNA